MPSPDQLQALSNPDVLKAFFADVKTSEIQSKLDAIKADGLVTERDSLAERLRAISEIRKNATY